MDVTRIESESSVGVVVAAHVVDDALSRTVAAYLAGVRQGDEVVVALPEDVAYEPPPAPTGVRLAVVRGRANALTPELWAIALRAATGAVVRVTIASCTPAVGWRAAALDAHADGAVAAGGAIDPAPGLRLRDQAVHFLRYRDFVRPFAARDVVDVPGDHCNYVRSALEETRDLWRDGFWEPEVNAVLAARGRRLTLDPRMVAEFVGGESARDFLGRRYAHGVRYGAERAGRAGPAKRALLVVVGPLPGVLFLAKIARAAWSRPARRGAFVRALPWILLFLGAWSLGEWRGAWARQRAKARA
jgi:hypothetical protein